MHKIYQCGKSRENPFETLQNVLICIHFFFLFTTCSLFCYTTAMSIVRFALLQKKLTTVSQKKTFTGRKGSSLTGSSSQRPHPRYQMVHLTIM